MTDAVLIAGPTASGKSAAALAIARAAGGTIINADSMQVYRELPVLTARPRPDDFRAVPHRLYGTIPAEEAYSVGRWAEDAVAAIDAVRREGRLPILAGGTGLYFAALLQGLSPVPDIPAEIRKHWREEAASLSAQALHDQLSKSDPVMAARLSPTDPQRIVRALEVIDATGVSLSDWQEQGGAPVLDKGAVIKLVVAPEREAVYAAIDARFDQMLEAGALEEVAALAARKLDSNLPLMRAHGVPELMACLAGEMPLDDAVASSVATIGEAIKAVMNATAQTRERVALSNLLRFNAQHNERIRGGAR